VERGYCPDLVVIGEVSSNFQGFVGKLVESCVAECSCDRPWPVERQAGEMTDPKNPGLDSVVFQESRLADPACSGGGRYRAERGGRIGSFGYQGTSSQWTRVESPNRNHSHPLTDRGHTVRGEHHVPLGEDGSLTDDILFGDGHLLEEDALGHHGTLTGKRGLLLLNDFDVRMEM